MIGFKQNDYLKIKENMILHRNIRHHTGKIRYHISKMKMKMCNLHQNVKYRIFLLSLFIVSICIVFGWWMCFQLPEIQANNFYGYDNLSVVEQADLISKYRSNSISLIGTLITAFGGFVLFMNFRVANRNIYHSQIRLNSERFSKASEMLGSQNIYVRIGGILFLEEVSKDSPEYHWKVIEILAAFIKDTGHDYYHPDFKRENSLPRSLRMDLTTAIEVISRRDLKKDKHMVNLRRSSFNNFNFSQLTLNNIDFSFSTFEEVSLTKADLTGSNFIHSSFYRCELKGTNFSNTDLSDATFCNCYTESTNFDKSIMLGTGFPETEECLLKTNLFVGSSRPFLCNAAIPCYVDRAVVDRNRDREVIPLILAKRYGYSLEEAQKKVEDNFRKKWEH